MSELPCVWLQDAGGTSPCTPIPDARPLTPGVPASRIGCTIVMIPYEVFFGHNTIAFTT